MGARATFLQSEVERIIRAARNQGATVEIDMKNWVVTLNPAPDRLDSAAAKGRESLRGDLAPDGEEQFDEN